MSKYRCYFRFKKNGLCRGYCIDSGFSSINWCIVSTYDDLKRCLVDREIEEKNASGDIVEKMNRQKRWYVSGFPENFDVIFFYTIKVFNAFGVTCFGTSKTIKL